MKKDNLKIMKYYFSKIKFILIPLLVFIFYFVLLFQFVCADCFDSDELDIYVGGKTIRHGFLLYKDFLSQHMPVSYYISAIFDLFGARSVVSQRICFFVFIALFWAVIVFRYDDIFSKKILFFYPVLYCSLITTYSYGDVILSEHLAGIGLIILFLEYLRFLKKKAVSIDSAVFISISILLSFGTIFLMAYPLFVIFLAVILQELDWKEKKVHTGERFLKQGLKVLAIIIIPWLIYLIYLLFTGTLYDFYFGTYKVNLEYYSKYRGVGSDIFEPLFSFFIGIFFVFGDAFRIPGNILISTPYIISILGFIYLIIYERKKEGLFPAVFSLLFFCTAGNRGVFNFHASQLTALFSLATSLMICNIFKKPFFIDGDEKNRITYLIRDGIAVILAGFILANYFNVFTNFHSRSLDNSENDISDAIIAITDENEPIVNEILAENNRAMTADRAEILGAATVPWMWDGYGKYSLERMDELDVKVMLYDKEKLHWNESLKPFDYAPELNSYVEKNFSLVKGLSSDILYVRNDYYEKAIKKINESKRK